MSGAAKSDWARFVAQGLTADLLPVVSDLSVPVSPRSRIKQAGKTPSVVNREGHIAGLLDWTGQTTTPSRVKTWSADTRLGICLQTRTVRALDVDIADPGVSAAVRAMVELTLGDLPCRWRSNSGKLLLAFRMPGEFTKRKLITEHGAIEFLATGQQFIAAGTHTSGVRYEWSGPDLIPEITPDEFEPIWSALAEAYGAEVDTGSRSATSHDDPVIGMTEGDIRTCLAKLDPNTGYDDWLAIGMAIHHETRGEGFHLWDEFSAPGEYPGRDELEHKWSGFGRNRNGQAITGGTLIKLAQDAAGERLDLSIRAPAAPDEFPIEARAEAGEVPRPSYEREKSGAIKATVGNALMAARRPDELGAKIGHDTFKDAILVAWGDEWRPIEDTDYTLMRERLEAADFKPIGREMVRDAVMLVAKENRFDSAITWANGLAWDGVPRVERSLVRYFSAEDNPYHRAVGLYMWTAMAGRLLTPGEKCDMVPVLVGQQGTGKSTGVVSLAPEPDSYLEVNLEVRDDNQARALRGKLVGELGELRGLQTRDGEAIKAWITRTHEEWIPKYVEFATKYARRVVFIGTTNTRQFLADETGERRWLPVDVGVVDVAAIERDRDQMWAESIVLYRKGGVQWRGAQSLAVNEHAKFKVDDMWHEPIANWLLDTDVFHDGDSPRCTRPFKLNELMQSALGLPPSAQSMKEQKRAAKVLRDLGFDQRRATRAEGGKTVWVPAEKCVLIEENGVCAVV